jgi:hypothetical protein
LHKSNTLETHFQITAASFSRQSLFSNRTEDPAVIAQSEAWFSLRPSRDLCAFAVKAFERQARKGFAKLAKKRVARNSL